ncbi:MAG: hypothetical protein ABL971_13920 [Vicinamibacterales bacterium]
MAKPVTNGWRALLVALVLVSADPRARRLCQGCVSAVSARKGRITGLPLTSDMPSIAYRPHVRARRATMLWCNGRTPALGFYTRLGFTAVGEEFVVPHSGPHYVMTRAVA